MLSAALKESIAQRLGDFPGRTSFYYKDLESGNVFSFRETERMTAASVIKLTIMAELFRQLEEGELDGDQLIEIKDADRVPICGVLTFMHTGLVVTPLDLCWLMITISDNMATNMLIDLLGREKIQANNRALGLEGMELQRKLFDFRPELRGLCNTITAAGSARLLELIYRRELVSPAASNTMMDMLLAQQCTNKIPLLLPGEGMAAHKTGEDDTVSHDVGILMAKKPCIVCFCNWQLEPGSEGRLNMLIGQIAREIWDAQGGMPAQ